MNLFIHFFIISCKL